MLAAHKEQPHAVVYLITNQVNGKTYVGVTRFAAKHRWTQHVYNAQIGKVTYLYHAIRKYGAENFALTVLASCLNYAAASEVEREIIKRIVPDYNQTNGGEITIGKRMPERWLARVIAANTGLKRTPEQRRRSSEIKKQQYRDDPDYRAKILTSLEKARANCDPTKRIAAVRAALRGRPMPPGELRDRWIAANRARVATPEQRAKIAEKHRKPVECVTLGVTFDSILEASAHLQISNSAIGRACAGIRQKTAGGMRFQYV
jgi:group I intron endonuclease